MNPNTDDVDQMIFNLLAEIESKWGRRIMHVHTSWIDLSTPAGGKHILRSINVEYEKS